MNLRLVFSLLLLGAVSPAVRAEPVSCPALAAAVRVGTCPAEEELRYTYMGYCSDNARMYGGDKDDVCSSFDNYRKLKNVVLWESGDGAFHAYVSCDLPEATLRGAQAVAMKVAKQGKITRVLCSYGSGLTFAYRTRAECRVQGAADCAADPAACTANCN